MKKCHSILLTVFLIFCSQVSKAQWETLANIPGKLSFPIVTVLNGEIHVMGGGGASGATDVHYRYDPATNKWDTLAPVPYKAQQPAGITLAGRIHYFGGGFPNSGSPVASHYSYNPVTNTWRKETNLTAARAIHYAVELNDTLYSLAGQGMKQLFEAYDTLSKKWIKRADLLDDSYWYGAHLSSHGKIYRFGGGGFSSPKLDAHVYDPKTKAWTVLPEMPDRSHAISGTALGDSIYLAGGYALSTEVDKVWVYNIKTQTYTAGLKLPQARNYHKLVTIGKCIYSVGGNNNANANMPLSLIRYCPSSSSGIYNTDKSLEKTLIKTFPDKIEIELSSDQSGSKITLIDMSGKVVFSQLPLPNELHHFEIFTGNFGNGIYVLSITTPSASFTKRVVIAN